ncbi:unnamed protein product [Musa hybrid cultivar]
MAYILSLADIEKARSIAESDLNTCSGTHLGARARRGEARQLIGSIEPTNACSSLSQKLHTTSTPLANPSVHFLPLPLPLMLSPTASGTYAFCHCLRRKSSELSIPLSSIESFSYCFRCCPLLSLVVLPRLVSLCLDECLVPWVFESILREIIFLMNMLSFQGSVWVMRK